MRTTAVLLFAGLAVGVWGQARPSGFRAHPAAPARPPVHRPLRGWGAWGGWGWGNPEPVRIVVQSPAEKEKPAPVVVNKEYVAERYSPKITEVATAPAVSSAMAWKGCRVTLTGGEKFEGAQCAEVDDALLVKSATGRRYRFSRDLVDSLQ